MNLSNFAILSIKGSDYCSIISLIIKNEAINVIQKCRFDRKIRNIMKHKINKQVSKWVKNVSHLVILKLKKIKILLQ